MSEKKQLFCNLCKRETNHVLINNTKKTYDNGDGFIEYLTDNIWQCCGCDSYTIEKLYTNNSFCDENNNPYYDIEYIPKRNENFLERKSVCSLAPINVARMYDAIIYNYNNGFYLFCVMGIRTCIEILLKEKDSVHLKLVSLINNANYLTRELKEGLDSCRFLGNKVTHEMMNMDSSEIKELIDLLEDLISQLYATKQKVARVKGIAKKYGRNEENKINV